MEDYPVRAGIFGQTDQAIDLVLALREEGLTWDEISVICSDEKKKELFPDAAQQEPTGSLDNQAMNWAGAGVLGLGGVAAAAAVMSTAGTALIIMGAFTGLAAAGTFTSLMATRGFESEASDYYEQAVQEGKILVAVEIPGDDAVAAARRDHVAALIRQHGGEPLVLSH